MKHAFRLSRVGAVAALALAALSGAIILAGAQANVSSTPDPFIAQITSSTIPPVGPATPTPTPTPTPSPSATPTPTPAPIPRNSFAADIDGGGRLVVIESNGDISTERTPHVRDASGQIVTRGRNNEDGNQEIFLLDYAQRRIFQITDTTRALVNPNLSPLASVNIDVEVVNLRPQMSKDGRYVVFISNAYVNGTGLTPKEFDGQANAAGLKLDGNTEIFLYEIPPPPPVADLGAGAEVPFSNLAGGRIRRITDTPASRLPTAGTVNVAPFFARDNDAPAVSDDTDGSATSGAIIAFTTRARSGNLGAGNPDGNSEVYLFEDNDLDADGGTFVQATNSRDVVVPGQPIPRLVFNNNPSLSGDGLRLAFISNADFAITGQTTETSADQGNGEIYVAGYNTAADAVEALRRVTTTSAAAGGGGAINLLSPGKRLSHNGNFLAFESFAVFNEAGGVTQISPAVGIYVYDIPNGRFREVVNRAPVGQQADGVRWPTFTGDNTRVVWASFLNLKTDGTVAAVDDATGLNPRLVVGGQARRPTQIFSAPVAAPAQVSRLTRLRGNFDAIQPMVSDTVRRIAFTSTLELGGGNPPVTDGSAEVFYLFIPRPDVSAAPSPTPAAVAFSTGASDRPVVAASPAPSPSPAVTGLAPGMLGIGRSDLTLAPAPREVNRNDADETRRRPSLPVELNRVSVSIDDAAAGLFFVAPNQINFVVPPGLAPSATLPVVIFNGDTIIRTTLVLNAAQPDIFTSTNGPGGRAAVLNVTNPCVTPPGEPFGRTTTRPVGSATTGNCSSPDSETVPTELLIMLTGVRNVQRAQVTVRIGATDLTGDAIVSVGPSLTPGFDQIIVRLPSTFTESGDLPVIVTTTIGGVTTSSRPADTAPRITIN